MPNDMSYGANGGPRYPPQDSMNGPGPSAPYNGPVGRGPPRPATANDARPPPHRTYPQQALKSRIRMAMLLVLENKTILINQVKVSAIYMMLTMSPSL